MTTSQAVLGWAIAAAAAVGAVGCTHAGGKVPVDTPAMTYQAPDIDEITGIDSDADSDKETSAEATPAPAPAPEKAAPKAPAAPAPKTTTPAPAPKK